MLMCVLAAVPFVHMTHLLLSTGANTLGNDLVVVTPLIGHILDGQYNWLNIFSDSFINSHADLFPVLMLTLLARTVELNHFVAIVMGLLLTLLVVVLLYAILMHNIRHSVKFIVLPVASFLFFSNAQITTLVFNFTSFQLGFSFLGFLTALWAILHFPRTWRSIVLVVLGCCFAAWSSGFGVAAWPALFLCLLLSGYRDPRHYIVFFIGLGLAALPYISFIGSAAAVTSSLTRFSLVLEILALPLGEYEFRDGMSRAGAFGLLMAFTGCALMAWRFRRALPGMVIPVTVMVYPLLSAYVASVSRDYPAPWYTPFACLFWTALAALMIRFIQQMDASVRRPLVVWLWVIVLGLGFSILYIAANQNLLDKAMFMWIRTPASDSCVRYFRTAPTFCKEAVFQWPGTNPAILNMMSEPLERHHLTNFSARQVWTLQGDFMLDNVVPYETRQIPEVGWQYNGNTVHPTAVGWNDFRRADLFIHAPNAVDWTLVIPDNTQEVTFSSAVAISETVMSELGHEQSDGMRFEVRIRSENGEVTRAYERTLTANESDWQPFSLSLADYIGQTITLTLATDALSNSVHDWGLYQYPRVDILLDPSRSATSPMLDLRALTPAQSSEDRVLAANAWQTVNMQPVGTESAWRVGDNGLVYQSLDVCFGDYTHLSVQITNSERAAGSVYFTIKLLPDSEGRISALDEESFLRLRNDGALPLIIVPMYHNDETHTYTVPLRLANIANEDRLYGLALLFTAPDGTRVDIGDVRLLASRNPTSLCD